MHMQTLMMFCEGVKSNPLTQKYYITNYISIISKKNC